MAHQAGSDWASSGAPGGGASTGDFDGRTQIISHGGGLRQVDVPIFDDLIAEFNEDFTMRVNAGEDECTVTILDNDDAPGIATVQIALDPGIDGEVVQARIDAPIIRHADGLVDAIETKTVLDVAVEDGGTVDQGAVVPNGGDVCSDAPAQLVQRQP